ncbi:MAG: hypothetical protein AB8G05_25800 [Oligoflexales bacterium]
MQYYHIIIIAFIFSPFKPSFATTSDLPIKGRSSFDYLLASQNKKDESKLSVPYPFEKLLALIKSQSNIKSEAPISVLFVPFGRSLQRFAADPNFFRYPRILATVNAQTPFTEE